jgi:hypothetical protein
MTPIFRCPSPASIRSRTSPFLHGTDVLTVQQAGHQRVQSLHLAQQPAHFDFGEDGWQVLGASDTRYFSFNDSGI